MVPGFVGEALAAGPVHRLFAAVLDAGGVGHGVEVVASPSAALAVILAGASGDVADAPAAVLATPEELGEGHLALAWARVDRVPLVVVVVQPEPGTGRPGSAAPRPGFKGAVVLRPADPDALPRAATLALAHPRGPVLVTVAPAGGDRPVAPADPAVEAQPEPAPDPAALDAAAARIAGAARPVVVAGLGTRAGEAPAWLRPFAESLPAPVLATLRAKGALADPHPLALGLVTEPTAAALLARADLVVGVGLDPVEPAPGAWVPGTPVLDLAPVGASAIGGRPSLVAGGVVPVLAELAGRLRGRTRADWDVAELDRLKRMEAAAAAARGPGRIARTAREMTVAGTVAAVGAGPAAAAVARAWQAVAPRDFLAPSVLAPAGFAPAAALAAALARPGARALAFVDAAELPAARAPLALAAARALPLTVVALGQGGEPDALPRALAQPGPAVAEVRAV